MTSVSWPEPIWLRGITDPDDRKKARVRLMLDIAALYASEDGHLSALSVQLDKDPSTLGKHKKAGTVPPALCVEIEKKVGRDIMPREALCPELFVVEG